MIMSFGFIKFLQNFPTYDIIKKIFYIGEFAMKKIMFILISVIMIFTACKNSSDNISNIPVQTQIDPTEEFGGITFGMTKEEVIDIHGREPDETFEHGTIIYKNETFFNIGNAQANYAFDDNGKLYTIFISYTYYKDSEDNSFKDDYDSIKEEFSIRYPDLKKDLTYPEEPINYEEDELWAHTDNRSVILLIYNSDIADTISITISDTEMYRNSDI